MLKKTPRQLAEAVPAASWVTARVATRREWTQGAVSAVNMHPDQASDFNSGDNMKKLTMTRENELLTPRSDSVPRDLQKQFPISISQKAIWLLLVLFCNGSMSAMDIAFDQLDWLDNNGGFTSEKSEWGEVTLRFSSTDTNLFTQTGSSFVGYVNIVTTVPGGNTDNWAVINAPVVFNNLSEFDYGYPETLWFDLGVPRGSNRVTSLNYRLTIDSAPLGAAPLGPMTLSGVGISQVLFGGVSGVLDGIEFFGNSGQGAPVPAFNLQGAYPGEMVTNKAAIGYTNANQIPVVTNEDINGCVPAAAARSIKYLTKNNLAFTNTVQDIYNTIKGSNYMNSNVSTNTVVYTNFAGIRRTNRGGTKFDEFVYGKTKYTGTNGLGITTVVGITNFTKVTNAISNGADVELVYEWNTITTSNGVKRTNYFAHCVMVTSITTLVDSNGIVSGYQVEWVDGGQGTINTTNRSRSRIFNTNGDLRTPLTNRFGERISSFWIETTNRTTNSSYNWNGGGKYLASAGQASIVRIALNGMASQDTSGNFSSSGPIAGSLTAFDSITRMEIDFQTFSQVEGSSLGGGNFTVGGQGIAMVNGTPTIINFEASKAGGVVTVKISDAETGAVLVSGTGEQDRADMQLTIIPTGSGNPIIKSMTTLPDGNVQILALGFPDTSYLVQATTNMINPFWATIGTATTAADGSAWFTDLHATNFSTRFYRLWLP